MRSTTQQPDLRARARAVLLACSLAVLAGLAAGACFNPPSAAVMFACDPAGSSACPAGYTCQDDGCCHKDGTDDPADDGACKLGGGGGGASSEATSEATGSTGAATSSTTTAGTTDTGGTSTDTGSSSSSTGPQTTGTT